MSTKAKILDAAPHYLQRMETMEQVWSRLQGQTDSRSVRKKAWNTSKSIYGILARYA